LGRGKRHFEDGDHKPLVLVDSRAFASGVVSLAYRPANEQREGDEIKDLTKRTQ
jgi:hypothetical protein